MAKDNDPRLAQDAHMMRRVEGSFTMKKSFSPVGEGHKPATPVAKPLGNPPNQGSSVKPSSDTGSQQKK